MIVKINSHLTIELLGLKNGTATFKYLNRNDKSEQKTQMWKIVNSADPETLQKIKELWPEEFI